MLFEKSAVNQESKIGTKEIITPVLLVMAHAERSGIKSLSTSKIRALVRQSVILSESDEAPLKGRNDTKFDQIVRNLVSHNTLVNRGYVRYERPRTDQRTAPRMRLTPGGRAYLGIQCLSQIDAPSFDAASLNVGDENTPRINEREILLPALLLLAKLNADRDGAPVPMTELRQALKASVVVAPADAAPLKGRKDTKVDQVIRNLVSHGTLEKEGWVERSDKGLQVTQAGLGRLLEEFLQVLPAPDFSDVAADNKRAPRRAKVGR